MDNLDFNKTFEDAMKKAFAERGHVNILIAGRTGVGKSTLINAVFQGEFAATGVGEPVTKETREINKADVPLTIFDTRGLEMKDFSTILSELEEFIRKRRQATNPKKHLHVAWVCVSEGLPRMESAEQDLVKSLSGWMPVIVVITNSLGDSSYRSIVQQQFPQAKNVVCVNSLPKKIPILKQSIPVFGLEELVELTTEVVPEGIKRAFVAAQKVDIEAKKNKSHGIVVAAAGSAAGMAAVPIPFSDAAAIVPIQVAMLAGVTATFGLSFDKSFLPALVGSVVTAAGGTLAGRTIVSGLLKLIPGVGSAVGGVIAATTAAALTTAFGEAYISTLALLFEKNNGEPPTQEDVVNTFKYQYALIKKNNLLQ